MATRGKQLPDTAVSLQHGKVPLSASDSKGLSKISSSSRDFGVKEADFFQAFFNDFEQTALGLSVSLGPPKAHSTVPKENRSGLCISYPHLASSYLCKVLQSPFLNRTVEQQLLHGLRADLSIQPAHLPVLMR